GDLIVGDWRSGQLRKPIRAHLARVSALDTLENGTVLVSGGRDRLIRRGDFATGEAIIALPGHQRQSFSKAISPDGQMIASGSMDGTEERNLGQIRLWRSVPAADIAKSATE
ncbi:MAG: WD40 repeat domain-containing protein, partial [Planctomycetaceae bacterium]